ncbi:MAG: hypothetical protein H6600_04715 [Flavobacteriales bacterium]|nr:hypothetical protein [Flavobacteriales bacterium]MCB9196729.1 hypothetical protein [Flavobacteriales bacterium]MCB9197738.1 hypothetical protein [Flavobacteriales bacterium]
MKQLLHFLVVALIISLASCSKYDKGPNISFRTKKERLTNTWYAYELKSPNGVVSLDQTGDYFNFDKDGDCEKGTNNTFWKYTGSWHFDQSKEYLEINLVRSSGFEYEVYSYAFRIIKLKHNKLILEDQQGQQIEYRSFD